MTEHGVADILKNAFICQSSWTPAKLTGVVILGVLTVACACASGLMWFTDIYVDSILNQMTLREGSGVFEAWRKPPVKPLICVHVFNYTNIDRFAQGLDPKIKLNQTGPYCYRETLEKKNITFNEDGTITYGDTRRHVFEAEHSKGSINDTLVVPNLALISTIGIAKNMNFFLQVGLSTLLHSFEYSHTLMTVQAHDFLFGYDDKLIDFVTGVAKYIGQDIPFDKFGLLSRRAAITDETITVATGTDDLERIGVVTEVDGKDKLDLWPEDECNRIDGSDGAFFPRHGVNESATIYLFHRDLCRRMPFIFDKEVDFQEGIMAMRFHAAPDVYNTEGTCYCTKDTCSPNGTFDLSPCSLGAPIMISFPHFLYGEPELREPFEGLSPDPEKHEFYIDVQRLLGFTLGTVSRLQLNLKIEKASYIPMLSEFPDGIILPIIWIQVSAERMPPDLFNMIYHATFTVQRIQDGLKWGTLVLTVIFCLTIYYIVSRVPKIKDDKNKKYNMEAAEEMLSVPPNTVTVVKIYPK